MKAYTSRNSYDERDRYTGVREQMGQVRLDSEANLQVDIARVDARRRSGDLAEGSPDDGFRITDTHLLDPVLSLDGWTAVGLDDDDERVITPQLRLVRRDPDTLPHVLRTRGHTAITRRMPGVDLLHLPVPLHPTGATYAAASIVVQVRFDRPPTDDEIVDVRVVVFDGDGAEHDVGAVPAPDAPDAVQASVPWTLVTVPIAALAPLRRGTGADETLVLEWLGPARAAAARHGRRRRAARRATAVSAKATSSCRGGDGTVTGAGRLFVHGLRTFLEHDWRYSLQPDLPDPAPLVRPTPAPDGSVGHHLVFVDVFDEVARGFSHPRIIETALGGEETAVLHPEGHPDPGVAGGRRGIRKAARPDRKRSPDHQRAGGLAARPVPARGTRPVPRSLPLLHQRDHRRGLPRLRERERPGRVPRRPDRDPARRHRLVTGQRRARRSPGDRCRRRRGVGVRRAGGRACVHRGRPGRGGGQPKPARPRAARAPRRRARAAHGELGDRRARAGAGRLDA